MTLIDEIQVEAWHILASVYTHQRLVENLPKSPSRYDLANQFVALKALEEMLVIRIARLADKRKDARSISMLIKRASFKTANAQVEAAASRFLALAEPVVKIRHEQIAHMKPGTLSSYEPRDLPSVTLSATEALIDLIDIAKGKSSSYTYRVGSMEAVVDLRASLSSRTMVAG